jgi:flagellar biosynthesis/type III secretory pathway protein FliH
MASEARHRVLRTSDHPTFTTRAAFVPAPRQQTFTQEDVDAAYTRGFLAGSEEAQGDVRTALHGVASKLDEARRAMIEELQRADAARRDEVVRLAFEVAQWLLQEELHADPTRVLARVAAALPDRHEELTLRVAPALVAVVAQAHPDIHVTGDPALVPGDVVIAGTDSQIDGTIEDALTRLRGFLRTDDDGGIR